MNGRTPGRRSWIARFGRAAAAGALVLAFSIPGASAATPTNQWLGRVGAGTATLYAYAAGNGSLALRLSGLKPSTNHAIALHAGSCATVGTRLVSLSPSTSTAAGGLTKTVAVTAAQMATVFGNRTQGLAVRVGSGSFARCGVLGVRATTVAQFAVTDDWSFGIAADAAAVWVVNEEDGTVSRIDPATRLITATISVGEGADSAVSDGTSVWVTNSIDNMVRRIDSATNSVVATIPVAQDPRGIAVGGGSVWVASETGNSVSRIDPATNAVSTTIPVTGGPARIAYGGGAVWAVGWQDMSISRIDPATNTVVASILVPGADSIVADETSVWVSAWGPLRAEASGSVARIDPGTNAPSSVVQVGYFPTGMALAGGALYVAMAGEPTVVQVREGAVDKVNVGMKSMAIAVANNSLWVLHPIGSAVPGTALFGSAVTRMNI